MPDPTNSILSPIAGLVGVVLFGLLISATTRWHFKYTADGTEKPQSSQDAPVPRIGGAAVLAGLLATAVACGGEARTMLLQVTIIGLPVFLTGLAEDLTARVPSIARLILTLAVGILFCAYTSSYVTAIGFEVPDALLSHSAIAIAFTAFMIAALVHATNIIDGFNGLATGTTVLAVAGIGLLAFRTGDVEVFLLCLSFASVLCGFLPFNFPLARQILGDGGAYLIGFVAACLTLLLLTRNPEVSPWSACVLFAYPLLETLTSILRKRIRGTGAMQPDSWHLHMLVYRAIGRPVARTLGKEEWANPVVGAIMWSGSASGLFIVLAVSPTREAMVAAFLVQSLLYGVVYVLLTKQGKPESDHSTRPKR